MSRLRTPTSIAALLLIAAVVVADAVLLTGGPVISLWITAVSTVAFLLTRSFTVSMAIAGAILIFLVIELILLRISALLIFGLPVTEAVVWTSVAVACAVVILRRPSGHQRSSLTHCGSVLASALGSMLLLAVVAVSQRLAAANAVAWAMRGDSVNVLVVSREIAAANGISPGDTQQPTPLPFGLIASNLVGGRESVSDSLLLAHDIDRYAQVWVLILAVSCLLTGLAVARPLIERSPIIAALAGAAASLTPLSWFWLGVQFQSGFENTSLAVAVLVACWIMYLEVDRGPHAVLTLLSLAATALLAVWSPLVLAPVFLIAVILLRSHRSLVASGWRTLVLPASAAAVLLAYGAFVTLPNYLQNADFLSRPGAFPAFALATAIVVSGLVALAAVAALSSGHLSMAWGAAALVLCLAVGTAYFMFQRRTQASLWGYYPQKYAYSLTLLLIVVAMSLVALMVANPSLLRRVMAAGLAAVGVLVIGILGLTSNDDPRPHSYFPLYSMLRGNMFRTSEALATTVIASSGRDDGLDLAWRFPEYYSDNLINFWWLQTDLRDPQNQADRFWAQREGPRTSIEVCMVIASLGEPMTIHTADFRAEEELRRHCNHLDFRVIVERETKSLYTGP